MEEMDRTTGAQLIKKLNQIVRQTNVKSAFYNRTLEGVQHYNMALILSRGKQQHSGEKQKLEEDGDENGRQARRNKRNVSQSLLVLLW